MRRTVIAATLLLLVAGLPAAASAAPANPDRDTRDTLTLRRYAADTWASLAAMTDRRSGLPADSLGDDGTRSVQTSTTNIGAYLWSSVAAEQVGILGRAELVQRVSR